MPITVPAALRTIAPTTSASAGTRAMKNRTLPAQTAAVRARRRADGDGRAAVEPQRDPLGVAAQRAADELAVAQEPRPVGVHGWRRARVRGQRRAVPRTAARPGRRRRARPRRRPRAAARPARAGALDVVVTAVLARARLAAGREAESARARPPARSRRPPPRPRRPRPPALPPRPPGARRTPPAGRSRAAQLGAAPEREPHARDAGRDDRADEVRAFAVALDDDPVLAVVVAEPVAAEVVVTCTHAWFTSRSGWSGDASSRTSVFAVTPASRSPSSWTWLAKMSM